MDDQAVHDKDIYDRLGRIESKMDSVVKSAEALRWVRKHIWALWVAVLSLVGVKVV